ncbi:hypothetical protein NNJEOMEG_03466 [Fundidesulfovibrio magnetotacticus]|uniref:Zinc resistance-associated protein n=1 Tax=Fundidesulfovibrio magnetotacticus TaxID=2730080 RepID=A0A6V8LZE3_9BACT|nr:periplasmic heavy metal sensor [Fundidesulfovibrio magnetotacticus]GFK95598.1 hypothetical protein NNJEOMEG_03466 [Fundidesulfovibrio magnetotacticus]
MKSRLALSILALAAVVAFGSLAVARPGGGFHAWLSNLPQEKQEQVAKLYAEGRQKLYDLESRKWAKQAEMNALLVQPKPDSAKIDALAKEIGTLSSMVYQERVALQQRILKETGVNMPLAGGPGGGYGQGCGGPGGGYGRGMGMGYGPGCGGPQAAQPQADQLPPCCQTPGQQTPQAPAQ